MDGCQWHDVHVSGVEEVCFQSSSEKCPRCQNRGWKKVYYSRYSRCRDGKGMLVEIRRSVRPVQGCSGARAQCHRWLVSVQLTADVPVWTALNVIVPSLVDMLAIRQPVQLLPQLSSTGTTPFLLMSIAVVLTVCRSLLHRSSTSSSHFSQLFSSYPKHST